MRRTSIACLNEASASADLPALENTIPLKIATVPFTLGCAMVSRIFSAGTIAAIPELSLSFTSKCAVSVTADVSSAASRSELKYPCMTPSKRY